MGREVFGNVLEAMLNDADIAEQVSGGGHPAMTDGSLTDEELTLLRAAAGELDGDVAGFVGYMKLGDIEGESAVTQHNSTDWDFMMARSPNVGAALGYMKLGDIKGE
jgi:hypothetical protein